MTPVVIIAALVASGSAASGASKATAKKATTTKKAAVSTVAPATTAAPAPVTTAAKSTDSTLKPISITIGRTPNNSVSLPWAVGDAQGFFKDAGLNVTQVAAASGTALVAGTIGGTFKFTFSPVATTLAAIKSGEDLTVVAPNLALNLMLIMRSDKAGPKGLAYPQSIAALKGRTIAVSGLGSLADVFLRDLAQGAGLAPDKDLTIIATGASTTAGPALKNGQIDGVIGSPATLLVLASQGLDLTVLGSVPDGTAGPNLKPDKFTTWGLTSTAYIRDNPEVFSRYCTSMTKTLDFMNDPKNEQKVLSIMADSVGFSVDDAAKVWAIEKKLWKRDMDEQTFNRNVFFNAPDNYPKFNKIYKPCQG